MSRELEAEKRIKSLIGYVVDNQSYPPCDTREYNQLYEIKMSRRGRGKVKFYEVYDRLTACHPDPLVRSMLEYESDKIYRRVSKRIRHTIDYIIKNDTFPPSDSREMAAIYRMRNEKSYSKYNHLIDGHPHPLVRNLFNPSTAYSFKAILRLSNWIIKNNDLPKTLTEDEEENKLGFLLRDLRKTNASNIFSNLDEIKKIVKNHDNILVRAIFDKSIISLKRKKEKEIKNCDEVVKYILANNELPDDSLRNKIYRIKKSPFNDYFTSKYKDHSHFLVRNLFECDFKELKKLWEKNK